MSKQVRTICDFCGHEIVKPVKGILLLSRAQNSIRFSAAVLEDKHAMWGWFRTKLHMCSVCRRTIKRMREANEKQDECIY